MPYIIDANNLAGQLNLLKIKNFDKELIQLIKKWAENKHKKIILVFDSNYFMGDQIVEDNITIIYTPRDNYYHNADDKIIELIEKSHHVGFTIVTNDIELKQRITRFEKSNNLNIKFKSATRFAQILKNSFELNQDKEIFNEEDKEKINRELLRAWNKK